MAKAANPYDKDTMRARLDELDARSEAIKAVSYPIREERDAIVQTAGKEEARLNAEIAKAEEGLYEIEQERAMLTRALGGRQASDVVAEDTEAADQA